LEAGKGRVATNLPDHKKQILLERPEVSEIDGDGTLELYTSMAEG
jgi:hypothetical protein